MTWGQNKNREKTTERRIRATLLILTLLAIGAPGILSFQNCSNPNLESGGATQASCMPGKFTQCSVPHGLGLRSCQPDGQLSEKCNVRICEEQYELRWGECEFVGTGPAPTPPPSPTAVPSPSVGPSPIPSPRPSAGPSVSPPVSPALSQGPSPYPTGPVKFRLEVNIGPFPIDVYTGPNTQYRSCSSAKTHRQCIQEMLQNYSKQYVTAIRFFFDLNGAADSTPLRSDGSVNPQWAQNLKLFFADVRASGISGVIPTPNYEGWWSPHRREMELPDPCANNQVKKFIFEPASVYGLDTTEHDFPPAGGDNRGYECGVANPHFVGWDKIYSVFDTVMKSARESNVGIPEFDIVNEINVLWFTVQARYIYDNKHSGNWNRHVYQEVRTLMSRNGFDPANVTYSSVGTKVTQANFDCTSAYGSSSRIINTASLIRAITGQNFGVPSSWYVGQELICGGNLNGTIRLPVSAPAPGIVDIHMYPCILDNTGQCDRAQESQFVNDTKVFFDGIYSWLNRDVPVGTRFALGETHSMFFASEGLSCDGMKLPMDVGSRVLQAFSQSGLFTSPTRTKDSNILRPWNFPLDFNGCYNHIQPINPPYNPY